MGLIKLYLLIAVSFTFYNTLNGQEIKRPSFLSKSKRPENIQDSIYDYEELTVPEIIQSLGYPAETHHVTTEDGYILALHRIPYGLDGPSENRPVALLQHGLLVSSFDWISDRPDRALAYMMADAGYDVWLMNARGNLYSRNHTTLDPDVDKEEFWGFTYDEIGTYDDPAAIDYALSVTGQDQIYYVGFSMGTTVFFIMMSERPEYVDKIKASALLAPVVYMNNIKGVLRPLANYAEQIDAKLTELGIYEFAADPSERSDEVINKFCSEGNVTAPLCYSFIYLICGFDPVELNKELYPIILAHEPGGTSVATVNHYAQQIFKDVFQKYDWGPEENQKRYGQETPPAFNLEGSMPPLAFFRGDNDFLADPEDVARVAGEIQNLQLNHRVEYERWSHIDFCWGIHAKEYVYDYVLEFFSGY